MTSERFQGQRILLVDDDPDVLESMELAFRAEGAEVVTAADGNTGGGGGGTAGHDDDGDGSILTLRGHGGWVKNVEPVGAHRVLTAGFDGTVRLWDVRAAKCVRTGLGRVD